MYSNDLLSVKN